MRKVVAAEFLSLDGVMESPDKWHFPYVNEEIGQAVGEGFAAADAMLMGRVNYEEWAAFWPQQDPEENLMTAQMNAMQKYVVSATLEEPLGWQNSTLINGNVAEEIAGLKQGEGGDIVISGSGTLVRSLLQNGLLDELKLMIHPILVGGGKRLFEDEAETKPLELVDSRTSLRAYSTSPTGRSERAPTSRWWAQPQPGSARRSASVRGTGAPLRSSS